MSVFGVFLVSIFQHSDWIRRDTPYLSVFSPNARKCGPEKLRIRTLFMKCKVPGFMKWFYNLSPFFNIECKSNKSQKAGSLNKVQLTDISDIHENCIPRDVPYLTLAWWWLEWEDPMREKCPYSELFWSLLSRNAGKYGPE